MMDDESGGRGAVGGRGVVDRMWWERKLINPLSKKKKKSVDIISYT
jgi:hypothetical protein